MSARIQLGVSSCLLGERVRYDGGHKRDGYVVRTVARHFELVPVCPEVGIGLGVPRPPIHLVRRGATLHAVGVDDPGLDVTSALNAYAEAALRPLAQVCGYIFKRRSPSCGLHDVPVDGDRKSGRGIYADALLTLRPGLPATDEAELADAAARDNFLERVFAYHRWQGLAAMGITRERLAQFHAAHKLALMAHVPRAVSELGRIIASSARIEDIVSAYSARFMQTLSQSATPACHENALQHIMGYLKKHIGRGDKAELLDVIGRYRAGKVSRAAVLKLLRRHFKRHPNAYILQQTYLYPGTEEKALRRL